MTGTDWPETIKGNETQRIVGIQKQEQIATESCDLQSLHQSQEP